MNSLIEIAAKVSTPLALAGVVVAILFYIFRQIIAKNIFPKLTAALGGTIIQSIIDKLFILALVAMVLGFAGYVIATFAQGPKPPPSVTISIPSGGVAFQEAVKVIAENDNQTAVFFNCNEALKGAKVEECKLTGKTSKELIEALQHRLIDKSTAIKYRVEHFKDRGIYEIRCD